MNDAKKLQDLLDALSTNANAFYIKLGYKSHGAIYHILNGKNNLSSAMIERIVKAYPNVNYNYLSSGQLPILLDEKGVVNQANMLNIPLQQSSESYRIQRIMDVPNQLDRIEEMLGQLLNKEN